MENGYNISYDLYKLNYIHTWYIYVVYNTLYIIIYSNISTYILSMLFDFLILSFRLYITQLTCFPCGHKQIHGQHLNTMALFYIDINIYTYRETKIYYPKHNNNFYPNAGQKKTRRKHRK